MSVFIMDTVWKYSEAKGSDLLVLLSIADNADEGTGEAYPGYEYLAAKSRLSKRAVQYCVKRLLDSGELILKRRGAKGRSNLYIVSVQSLRCKEDQIRRNLAQDSTQPGAGFDATHCHLTVREPSENHVGEEVQDIYNAWIEATGRNPERFKLTSTRKQLIQRRLREFSGDDLLDAVRGIAKSAFHRGENDRRQRYDTLEVALRNAEKIEQFRDLNEQPTEAEQIDASRAAFDEAFGMGTAA